MINRAQEVINTRAKVQELIAELDIKPKAQPVGFLGEVPILIKRGKNKGMQVGTEINLDVHQYRVSDIKCEGYYQQIQQLKGMREGYRAVIWYEIALANQTAELQSTYHKSSIKRQERMIYRLIRKDSKYNKDMYDAFDNLVAERKALIESMVTDTNPNPGPILSDALREIVEGLFKEGALTTRVLAAATATGKYSASRWGDTFGWDQKTGGLLEGQMLEHMDLHDCDYNKYAARGVKYRGKRV